MKIIEKTFTTDSHTTGYLDVGSGPAMIFLHGWPELSLSWRHQLPFFAERGLRCIAPDMRGYGRSTHHDTHDAYAQRQVVADMMALLDELGIEQAIWVGHDWGCATVWSIASHHPQRCMAVANLCVPYHTIERGWDGLLPYVDRNLYPVADYPAGQWEYMCFYEENFAAATAAFDEDPHKVAKLLFRKGNPLAAGQVSGTAMTRIQRGWFGGQAIPDLPRDDDVITEADLQTYAASLARNSFFGPGSYYMNHARNAQYTGEVDDPELKMPVLFLHGRYDYTCETMVSTLARPMRELCSQLREGIVDSGHWMAQEQPAAVNTHINQWLDDVLEPSS